MDGDRNCDREVMIVHLAASGAYCKLLHPLSAKLVVMLSIKTKVSIRVLVGEFTKSVEDTNKTDYSCILHELCKFPGVTICML